MACDEKHHAAWKSQEQNKTMNVWKRELHALSVMDIFSVHSLGKIYALEFTSQWLSLPVKVVVAQCLGGYIGKRLLG